MASGVSSGFAGTRVAGAVTTLVFSAVLMTPGPAAAQASPLLPARLSIGGGAGVAFPLRGEFDFVPVAWEGTLRAHLSPRVALEAMIGEWRHGEDAVLIDVPVSTASGAVGVIGRVEQETSRVQRAIQAGVVISRGTGRVRPFGGGGGGLLRHVARFRQSSRDCSATVADACGDFETASSRARFAVQGTGGIDVHVAGRLWATGQLRGILPVSDAGSGDLRVTAGARWTFDR